MKNPKSCFFKATPSQLLTGVPLWTTTFLSGIKKKLNSCTKDEELIECADSALRKVVELSPSKVHRGIKDFKFESSLFKTNEKILSAVIFSLIGPGIGSMNHSLGADLVRASCGLVVPYDPRKLYVDAKDVVERCAVRAAPGILYSIAAYRRDMELFSAALLNFAFCDATSELTDDSSHVTMSHVTSSPAPVVTLERLLKSMVKISTH
ncbi:hypothetical protein ADUPG1_001838, partial [Aduncisulcus paluster]